MLGLVVYVVCWCEKWFSRQNLEKQNLKDIQNHKNSRDSLAVSELHIQGRSLCTENFSTND